MSSIRIGLIGVGGICGKVHFPGLTRIPGVEVAGLCNPNGELLSARSEEWEIKAAYTTVNNFWRKCSQKRS